MAHIRAEAAYGYLHVFVLESAKRAGELEEFQGFFKRYRGHRLALQQRREARLLLAVGVANLHHGAETAYLDAHRLAGTVFTKTALAEFGSALDSEGLVDRRVEQCVER